MVSKCIDYWISINHFITAASTCSYIFIYNIVCVLYRSHFSEYNIIVLDLILFV